jgi:hypothetical protein
MGIYEFCKKSNKQHIVQSKNHLCRGGIMPAISNKEVIIFSSQQRGVLGVYDSFKSLYDKCIKRWHRKHLPVSQEELIVYLLNYDEYSFGQYKLELRKVAEEAI